MVSDPLQNGNKVLTDIIVKRPKQERKAVLPLHEGFSTAINKGTNYWRHTL